MTVSAEMSKRNLAIGVTLVVIGCVMLILGTVKLDFIQSPPPHWLGFLAVVVGALLALVPKSLSIGKEGVKADFQSIQETTTVLDVNDIAPKKLSKSIRSERERCAEALTIPGRDAPPFKLVNDLLTAGPIPSSEPYVPMYVLDNNYRIIDWNNAFSLAFDRTMDGMRGLSVLDWVYFLENSDEVIKRGAKDFADPDNLPLVHVEDRVYKSNRYGDIAATKRSYQIPKDDQSRLGWLTILELAFADRANENCYKLDLIKMLRMDMVWSEYAVSYDPCLTNTTSYPELLACMLGETRSDSPKPIDESARVLDLGAGTGNITYHLARSGNRIIYAFENNVAMYQQLRTKCKQYLRTNETDPGVRAIKQDVQSLRGLDDNSFDVVIMNNVAYALDDSLSVFRQVYDRLKPGGEIRVSGPTRDTDLSVLFEQLKRELERKSKFGELQGHYQRVKDINERYLSRILYKWTIDDLKSLLLEAGFDHITFEKNDAYAGQAMIVCAGKEANFESWQESAY